MRWRPIGHGAVSALPGGAVRAKRIFATISSAIFRGGLRSYFPLLDKGELLSASIGASLLHFDHRVGAAWSAGIYTLYGFVGAEITYCPTPELRSTTLTLSLRMF